MIKHRKIFYIISVALVFLSIVSLIIFRLPLGIDFTGGSMVELRYSPNTEGVLDIPKPEIVSERLADVTGQVQIQKTDDGTLLLRMRDIDENTHQQILERLQEQTSSHFQEERFETVGPVIGKETIKVPIILKNQKAFLIQELEKYMTPGAFQAMKSQLLEVREEATYIQIGNKKIKLKLSKDQELNRGIIEAKDNPKIKMILDDLLLLYPDLELEIEE